MMISIGTAPDSIQIHGPSGTESHPNGGYRDTFRFQTYYGAIEVFCSWLDQFFDAAFCVLASSPSVINGNYKISSQIGQFGFVKVANGMIEVSAQDHRYYQLPRFWVSPWVLWLAANEWSRESGYVMPKLNINLIVPDVYSPTPDDHPIRELVATLTEPSYLSEPNPSYLSEPNPSEVERIRNTMIKGNTK